MGPEGGGPGMGPGGGGIRLAAFSSLRIRDFRWLWLGNLFSFNAMQMQMVARGWLVYTMTGSPLALGLVSAGFGVPMILFSLYGGVIADRVRKRNLLLVTQAFMCLLSLVITILINTDLITLWHLVVASLFSGVIFSFMMPARSAFLVEMVEEEDLMNAVSLSSMAMNISRIASPAIAGVLLKVIDVPGTYWVITLSYCLTMLTTTKIPLGDLMTARPNVPMLEDVKEGLRYVIGNKIILAMLLLSFIPILVAMPYQMLMPVFARSVFHSGETGLGMLMSATGLGALVGSTIMASLGNFQHKGLLMLFTGIGFGLFLMVFGYSGSLIMASVWLVFVGGTSSMFMTATNTLLMTNTPQELMGRVMSLFMMTFGLMPIGTLPAGALAEAVGAPFTVFLGGAILFLFLAAVTITQPYLRKLN
jgi:MFS family permease